MNTNLPMTELAARAHTASRALAILDTETKNRILRAMADGIEQSAAAIRAANTADLDAGRQAGLADAMLDRLLLNDQRLAGMADGLRQVAALDDPVGTVIRQWQRPNGLQLQKVRVPLGTILIIYESRPNVTADAAGLCLKAGNAVILRGGSEAIHSNLAIAEAMVSAAADQGLPADSLTVVPTADRQAIDELLKLDQYLNLVIPRGGEGLIRAVTAKSHIPVIKHYKGVCHVYVDREADLDMAENIVINAKCQRPGVCNAIETLLVDEAIAPKILPRVAAALHARNVELRIEARAQQHVIDGALPLADIKPATEEDWHAEYLGLVLAIRTVNGIDGAIDHINQYGSGHTDAIVTRNEDTARRFLREIDSSSVMWNASTRFADGGEYGFGAEIGISTDKLHARGPMGLEDLTSYKYLVTGDGQVRE